MRCCRWILRDPEIYPDPDEFKPERSLNKDGSFRDDPTIALAFGVGKRICPGRHIVDATLFIVASSVLSVFNVTEAKDGNGREIPVRAAMTARTRLLLYVRVVAHQRFSIEADRLPSSYPKEFQCSISPRDKVAENLILASS